MLAEKTFAIKSAILRANPCGDVGGFAIDPGVGPVMAERRETSSAAASIEIRPLAESDFAAASELLAELGRPQMTAESRSHKQEVSRGIWPIARRRA